MLYFHIEKIIKMAEFNKQKADLNKDGSLSDYELKRGKAVAAAMPMLNTVDGYKHLKATAQKRMGHQMNFGSKQVNTPSAFSNYDYGMMMDARDERNAEYGEEFTGGRQLPKVEYVNPPGEQNISMQEAGLQDPKSELKVKETVQPVTITNKAERVGGKIGRLERRKALQEFKGKQRLDKGFTLGANQKRKRIANIEKRQKRLRNRLK
jgi:hypothetical protein